MLKLPMNTDKRSETMKSTSAFCFYLCLSASLGGVISSGLAETAECSSQYIRRLPTHALGAIRINIGIALSKMDGIRGKAVRNSFGCRTPDGHT